MAQQSKLIRLIRIPKIFDDCFLYFAQTPAHIPFTIKRIYYITKPDIKLLRGFHAHYKTEQILFCIQGSIKLTLDDGRKREKIILNKPNIGVFLSKMIWCEMEDFKKDTILLVLTSRIFEGKDYIRNYDEFKKQTNK